MFSSGISTLWVAWWDDHEFLQKDAGAYLNGLPLYFHGDTEEKKHKRNISGRIASN
jgi:hypothetical protein